MLRRFPIARVAVLVAVLVGSGMMAASSAGAATTTTATMARTRVSKIHDNCNGGKIMHCYVPNSFSINIGDTVTWQSHSIESHDVTRCTPKQCNGRGPGSGDDHLNSPDIAPGGSFSHTFRHNGSYNYYCTIHGFAVMHGTITVHK